MYLLEIVFVLLLVGLVAAQVLTRIGRRYALALAAAALLVLALAIFLGQARWQMAPGWLLFGLLALSLLPRSAPAALRVVGAVLSLLLLAVAVGLSLALPVMRLPAPSGPYAVGVTAFALADPSRDEARFGAPDSARELSVLVWYPAVEPARAARARPRTLWAEIYRGEQNLFTRLFGYMHGLKTHSYDGLPVAQQDRAFPMILFSHGMTMGHPEQNTLLMEHLASHGFVVAAVGHAYMSLRINLSDTRSVGADFDALNAAVSDRLDDVDEADFLSRVEAAASAEERARLWDGYFDNASGLNELMEVWVADLAFTADALSGPDAPPEWIRLSPAVRSGQVGVMGMSFGGGAVAEFCKADARCAAGLNLDGGPYGLRRDEPLQIPYLVMSSPANDGSNAALMQASRADFYDASVAGAAHADFMDLTLIAPVMKWTGANGPIEGNRMIDLTNAVALAFFDAYLRDGPEPQLDAAAFPELTVTAKAGPDG